MAKKNKAKKKQRNRDRPGPTTKRSANTSTWTVLDNKTYNLGLPPGYHRLIDCPTVITAVDKIADLVSSMTIHLMHNTEQGDERIKNGLSRKLDIEPCAGMNRKEWIYLIVRTLLLEGDGNAVVMPTYSTDGTTEYIENLIPVPPNRVSFDIPSDWRKGYRIQIDDRLYNPDSLIHFRLNPDPNQLWKGRGYRIPLAMLCKTLAAGEETKQEFLSGRYMPSVIVKVDTDEDTTSEEGKAAIRKKYVNSERAGEPWIIPADLVEIQQLTPLSLSDIAINETLDDDKKMIAALLGIPAFLLGVGQWNADEYNTFIRDRILSIAKVIEQTLTRCLIYSDSYYFRFNARSLYAYDIATLASVGQTMHTAGMMTGNEVRDWIGLDPIEGLDDLIQLENYIPADMAGDQNKLTPSGKEEEENDEGI